MVNESDLREMIGKVTKQLNAIGFFPKKVNKIRFTNATSFYAQVHYSSAQLDFSNYFREAPLPEIQGTIMHELLHLCDVDHGHGRDWKDAAEFVNKSYPEYNIARTGSQTTLIKDSWSLTDAKERCTGKSVEYVDVVCPHCGYVHKVNSRSRILKELNYRKCAKCSGKLNKKCIRNEF